MSNPHRGHVDLKAGEKTYKLVFSVNGLCEVEDATGKSVNEIARMLSDPASAKISFFRVLVWGALREFHPDVDLKESGNIAQAAGMAATGVAIGKAFRLAFPEIKMEENKVAEGVVAERPPKAGKAGGIG